MPKKDLRVDAYIAKAQPFAQPILKHLRKLVHDTCPDVQETIKWSFPCFDYQGPFCQMASFKEHAVFGFWKAALMKDSKDLKGNQENAMGHLGRITSLKDLPSDKKIIAYIKEAMVINEKGMKLPGREKKIEVKVPAMPTYFKAALNKNKKAAAHFQKFVPGQKKDYIVWLTEAKTEETREKRLGTAIDWISEGKIRNWKYVKK